MLTYLLYEKLNVCLSEKIYVTFFLLEIDELFLLIPADAWHIQLNNDTSVLHHY